MPVAPAPAGSSVVPPKPPATIARTERFIAAAICWVSSVPEAPTSMPATIRALLSRATPVAAADRPVKALKSEMTTGMSAPPIGSTSRMPSTAALTRRAMKTSSPSTPATIAAPAPAAARPTRTLSGVWSRPAVIGLPPMSSWSLANATAEPQNEMLPTIAANTVKIATYVGSCA